MKRSIVCICVFILSSFLLILPVYAADTTAYTIDELGLTVSLPSDYTVFTRDIEADDPNLYAYGFTRDSILSLMNSKNIYLNAFNEKDSNEIVITMIESPLIDFNLYSDTTLTTMATAFTSEYEAYGITYIKSEIYQHEQAKFLKIYISQPYGDTTAYGLQYYTVYADKAINITLQSYSGQITPSNEAILKSIVDSAVFDTDPQIGNTPAESTSEFIYTDSETLVTFTVPENWTQAPLAEEREYIDVKFTLNEDQGMCILYGSSDVWSEIPISERAGLSRSDIDNTIFTKTDIAEKYGVPINNVSIETYGGIEYYKIIMTVTDSVYGVDLTVTMTQFFYIENGYMYYFQFSGTSDNKYYEDFEALLESVKYKGNTNIYPSPSSNAHEDLYPSGNSLKTDSTSISSEFNLGDILLSLIVTIAVYSLPIIIYRYAIKKEPVEPRKAKTITIIYGIIAFIAMSALIFTLNGSGAAGGAILLWSYINYRMLTGGSEDYTRAGVSKNADIANADAYSNNFYQPHITTENYKDEVKYCDECGNRLQPGSVFCNKCGAKLL